MDKWLTNNNVSKLIALFFSIILWAMVHIDSGTPVTTTTVVNTKAIDVQIQVTGFDSDQYVLYDLEPSKVKLEVSGKRLNITTNFSDYKVKLDLKNIEPGTYTLPLTEELPAGVQLVSMDPAFVKVTIEAKATKEVPVTIVTTGAPKEGLDLGSPVIVDEGKIQVTLPESEMDQLSKVQGTIDVSGLNDSVKGKSVKLIAYDKQGNEMVNAEISPGSVEVDIPLNKIYKTIPFEISQTGQLPEGYVLSGIKLNVEGVALYGSKEALYGSKEALEGIKSYPISIDLSKSTGSTETKYMVDLTPPEGFEKIEPSSVEVSLHIVYGGKRQIDGIPITLTGEAPNLTAKLTDPLNGTISLTVIGAEDVISKLTADDIKVMANLSELTAGTHSIPVEITLPDEVKLIDADQSKEVVVELIEKANQATTSPEGDAEPSGENGAASSNGDHGNADLSTNGEE